MGTYLLPVSGSGVGPDTLGDGDWTGKINGAINGLDARARQFHIRESRWEGPSGVVGLGSAAADMYATNAALAYIAAVTDGREKRLNFGGGGRLVWNARIDCPAGVNLRGGPGSEALNTRKFTIYWAGTAGDPMLRIVNVGDRVIDTRIEELVFRGGSTGGLTRPGTPGTVGIIELGDSATSSGTDFGTEIYRCNFSNIDGPAVYDRFGATNFHMSKFRVDNFKDSVFKTKVGNAASHIRIDKFTTDNTDGSVVGSGGGYLLDLDGTNSGNNHYVDIAVANGKCEINKAMGGEKALILARRDTSASQGIMHKIRVDHVTVVPGGGVSNDFAFVGLRGYTNPTGVLDATASRMIDARVTSSSWAPGATGRLIDGVIEPPDWGSYTGKIETWFYTPQGFGFASPGSEGVFDDLQTQMRIRDLWVGLGPMTNLAGSGSGRGLLRLHNALAIPTSTPTAGFEVYVDPADGRLKARGASGTVTVLAQP